MSALSTAEPAARAPARRIPALDGLRGIAIVLVLLHNWQLIDAGSGLPSKLAVVVMERGWVGVQLFFALSGFLITGILLDGERSTGALARFYARRSLRIFPLYYLMLVLLLGVTAVPVAHWFYLSNWTQPVHDAAPALSHLWSLCVEEQFYLLWPLIVYRLSAPSVLRLCIGIALASLAIRTALVLHGVDAEIVYENSLCRMDALALGAAGAAFLRMRDRVGRTPMSAGPWLVAAGVVAALAMVFTQDFARTSPMGQTLGYSALALVSGLVVLAAAVAAPRSGRWLQSPIATAMGRYSYALYLVHKPLHNLVGKPLFAALMGSGVITFASNAAYFAVMLVASLALAAVLHRLIEMPIHRWRERFAGASSPTTGGSPCTSA